MVWGGPINYLIHEQITQTNSRHLHNESVTNRRADVGPRRLATILLRVRRFQRLQ